MAAFPRSARSRTRTRGIVSGPPWSKAPYPSRLRPRYPRRFFGATTTRVPPPAAMARREVADDNKESVARREGLRGIAQGQRSRPVSTMRDREDFHGPDGEHAEVHEREPAPDQRQAAELRDVEHLRDRGDLAQGI